MHNRRVFGVILYIRGNQKAGFLLFERRIDMALNGIDVSHYQGTIDWNQVKEGGIAFAMLRGGYGQNNVDTYFHRNAAACQRLGLPFGIYWFSYAYTTQMAAREAEYCIALAEQYKTTWPLAFDLEYDTVRYGAQNGVTIGKTLATDMVIAFCEKIKSAGYTPMYYTNLDYYRTMFDTGRLPYDLWFAQYASAPSITGMAMWQYTSAGKVMGISGDCDRNYSYKDYGTGTTEPEPAPSVPSAYTVQPGDTLSGIALRFGTTVSQLAALNSIADPDKIYAGQVLRLTGSPSGNQTIYTVKAGDTLSEIAARFGTTYQVLAQLNGISDPDRIYPGQTLRIPSGAQASAQYYTIRSGDTLSGIAARFGTTVKKLQELNQISDPDKIYAGSRIRIP